MSGEIDESSRLELPNRDLAVRDKRSSVVLLDLSGNEKAAKEWATARFSNAVIQILDKAELKWISRREALARIRAIRPDAFSVFAPDLILQNGLRALLLFAILAGARRVLAGDLKGRDVSRSRLGVLFLEAPRYALELLFGYGLLVPLAWLFTEALGLVLYFRATVRASLAGDRSYRRDGGLSLKALYIRATLTTAQEGGMPTHVAGFASGAAALGHQLEFLVSGPPSRDDRTIAIQPSASFTATKALFELWNNFVFTFRALILDAANGADFLYQRYSRFNWTGVVLSAVTGLPLAIEYNGSEVWISRQWDPSGLVWLLKRFERLNLRAADYIFVVSEVEYRNLIETGISSAKIVVNPNGVDTDRFCPNCGGDGIRSALGIDRRVVVGFVGTFGPWHGAPVLAEAATRLNNPSQFHFLFIGAGEQRAKTESIISSAPLEATFSGSVPHDKVPAYLDACDILASPHVRSTDGTEFFGSPTKLFEYLATGKGIVASRLGQISEVIVDGKNGLLVEPGDSEELARSIEKLATDTELRERLGTAARATAIERYTWRHNASRVFDRIASSEQ